MGESLLDPGFMQKVKWLRVYMPDVIINVTTKGLVLDKWTDAICDYVDNIKFSHYGFSKKTFESVHRGSLVYEKVKENIENFLLIPKVKRPKVLMSFVVLEQNSGEEWKWKNYWEEKCEEVTIWKPHNWTGAFMSETILDRTVCRSCNRPGKDFTIRANGDVSVCCWDFNREMSVGNINDKPMKEIFFGEKLQFVMDMHKNKTFWDTKNICNTCDQLYDRTDALVYSSNRNFRVGEHTNH